MASALALTLSALLAQTPPPPPPENVPAQREVVGESSATPDDSPLTDAGRAFGFAEWLLAEGDHYRAIGEFKRSLFLDPSGANADAARMAIGLAYLRGGQADAAAAHFRRTAREVSPSLRPDAALQAAYARYVGGQQGIAYEELSLWLTRFGAEASEPSRDRARYLLGWTQLELAQDTQAAATFAAIQFTHQPDLLAAVKKFQVLPHKSPVLAGILSIVPGAGHVYIEQPLIGITALLWNGLFGFALFEAISQRQIGLAVALGMFEAMWYSGSIFGAVNGAIKFNRDARRNALEDLRERFDDRPESWPPAPAKVPEEK